MSQPELVRRSGLTRQHVHSLLKNNTLGRMPEDRTIAGLAKAFPDVGEEPFLTKAAIAIGVPVERLTVVEPDYSQLSDETLIGILRSRLERGGQRDAGTADAQKNHAGRVSPPAPDPRVDLVHLDEDVVVHLHRGDEIPAELVEQLAAYAPGIDAGRVIPEQEQAGEEDQDARDEGE